jgi:rubrerythrin
MIGILFVFMQFLPFIIVLSVVFSIVRVRYKNLKNNKQNNNQPSQEFKNTISNANDENGYWNSVSSADTSAYCDYCGAKFERVKKRCPSCGARVQKK